MYLEKMNDDYLVKPNGNYNHGVKIGDFVYLSMMLPKDIDGTIDSDALIQMRQVMDNIKQLLSNSQLEMHHIVKLCIYVTDMSLSNDLDKIYEEYFDKEFTLPARSFVCVKELPNNAKVAIDGFAIDTLNLERQADQHHCNGGCGGCGCHE